MNYRKCLAQIWELRSQGAVSVHEQDLYCYLLHRSHLLNAAVFEQSSRIACAVLSINSYTLSRRRKKLEQLGLIRFAEGTGKNQPPQYEILVAKKSISNTSYPSSSAVSPMRGFVKPTVAQIAEYCTSRNNGINAQRFYDFYESKNWYVGRNKMKDWQASVRTWESNGKERRSNIQKHDNTISYEQF